MSEERLKKLSEELEEKEKRLKEIDEKINKMSNDIEELKVEGVKGFTFEYFCILFVGYFIISFITKWIFKL